MVAPVRPGPADTVPVPPAAAGPAVTVVMVVYRTGPALAETLRTVLADGDVDELVVVDNGSTGDEAAAMDEAAARSGARMRVLRGQGNVGFGRGANLGAEAARGRVLVFLNPDAFLKPGCVRALQAAIDPARPPCLVGARVMSPDGTEQRGARRGEVTPLSTVLSLTGLAGRLGLRRYEIHREAEAAPDRPVAIPTVSGACFAMTRADFAAVQGFDEGFFLHVEDIDLCWRVREAGGVVLFQPAAEVVHIGSTSEKTRLFIEINKGLGLARYFRKRARTGLERLMAWAMLPPILAASAARAAVWRRPRRD